MEKKTVHTSLDIPVALHRRLHEADGAAPERPPRRLNLDKPIIPSNGRKPFDLTNEQIYDLIEFP